MYKSEDGSNPPKVPHPPPPRTTRGTARRNQGSTVFWRKNQGFGRKKQGLEGKSGKRKTPRKRRRRDNDNIDDKTVASPNIIENNNNNIHHWTLVLSGTTHSNIVGVFLAPFRCWYVSEGFFCQKKIDHF